MFNSVFFWAVLIVTAACSAALPAQRVRARSALLALSSLFVLRIALGLNLRALLVITGLILWVIAVIRFRRRVTLTRSLGLALPALTPVLALWALGKLSVTVGSSELRVFYVVGFSFMVVKALTLIMDVADGEIEEVDPWVASAYFLYFPCYVAGPMHRLGEFTVAIARPKALDGSQAVDIVFRIMVGLVKLKVLVPLVTPLSLAGLAPDVSPPLTFVLIASFTYSLVIWLDFSGYCDLAIATSGILGIHVPENFNRPYLARNIGEFWQRWHMTFTRVLTGYVFVPLARRLRLLAGDRSAVVLTAGSLITFLLCGYWHGPTPNFLLWGLYHGVGLVSHDLYRRAVPVRDLRAHRRPLRAWGGQALGIAATFSFVSVGWLFFAPPPAWTVW